MALRCHPAATRRPSADNLSRITFPTSEFLERRYILCGLPASSLGPCRRAGDAVRLTAITGAAAISLLLSACAVGLQYVAAAIIAPAAWQARYRTMATDRRCGVGGRSGMTPPEPLIAALSRAAERRAGGCPY